MMNMEINGNTRTIGLIGNPVEHTLSPVIHNGISNELGICSVYVPFKVEDDGVEAAVKGAYELNILGMNVTVPHKNRVMEVLVDIDDGAKHIGSVNTLVRVDDKHGYKGYNTDMLGLQRQIHEDGISLLDKIVVVLGAGGAAKAVVYMCLLEGASCIYLLNRTIGKAKDIANSMNSLVKEGYFNHRTGTNRKESDVVIPMELSDYKAIQQDKLMVFQATSIGLAPNIDNVVIDDDGFYERIDVGIDLIYNPANTRFMQLVREHGGKAYNALKMLLYQGVIAYELWHNIKVTDELVEDIYTELKRRVYPKDNIVLIGFMGSGKTTVGKALAKRLNMVFIDTDEYLEKREGMTIAEIFERKGEVGFRMLETEVLKEMRDNITNTVVSTGGGMPIRQENARLLKEMGKVVYLTAANQVIYERIKDDTTRPLLKCDNPLDRITSLMRERRPLYEKACDIIVDTNSNDLEEVIGNVCTKA